MKCIESRVTKDPIIAIQGHPRILHACTEAPWRTNLPPESRFEETRSVTATVGTAPWRLKWVYQAAGSRSQESNDQTSCPSVTVPINTNAERIECVAKRENVMLRATGPSRDGWPEGVGG